MKVTILARQKMKKFWHLLYLLLLRLSAANRKTWVKSWVSPQLIEEDGQPCFDGSRGPVPASSFNRLIRLYKSMRSKVKI